MQVETLLYRPSAAAKIIDTSTRTIYRLIADGQLKAVTVEGTRGMRIHRSELEKFASLARPAITGRSSPVLKPAEPIEPAPLCGDVATSERSPRSMQ